MVGGSIARTRRAAIVAPLIREAGGRTQMVLSGSKCVASYNPDNGQLIWIIDGPTEQFVASPVFSEKTGLFYVTGGFPDHHILAIRPDGTGNVTNTHIAWHHQAAKGVAYVPSPIIEGNWFLITDDRGFATPLRRRQATSSGNSASAAPMRRSSAPEDSSISSTTTASARS